VTVTLRIAADAPGDVRFIGAVSGGGQLYEDNDTAMALKYVAQKPDLRVAIAHEGTFRAGGTGRYTIVVSNTGFQPTDGSEVKVTVTAPAGLTAVALGGTGWTCATSTLTCTRSDVLAGGGDYPPIALFVDIGASAPATVTTSAAVSGGGEVATGNDTASDATPVAPAAAAAAVDAPARTVTVASGKVSGPLLAARGSLGFALTCAQRCTLSAKLVLSRASARALHLRSRTVRTLARTVTTSKAQRLELSLPARVRTAARRHHVKKVSVTLTITARYADGRRTTTTRTVHVRI
jgi:uncharacterized repeat protein (TIGR01451 family)